MNAISVICTFASIILLSITLFASAVKSIFTTDELDEMGICIDPEVSGSC